MENILICHRGALGDYILTWPALQQVRTQFPGCRMVVLGRPEYQDLALSLGIIESSYNAESAAMIPFFTGTKLPTVLKGFSHAFLWLTEGEPAAELLTADGANTTIFAPFPTQQNIHVAHFHSQNMAAQLTSPPPPFEPQQTEPLNNEKGPIFIHPGSGSISKNFSPYLYATIAVTLARSYPHHDIHIILGPVEQGLINNFTRHNLSVIQPKNVKEFSMLIKHATLYIGNDSGTSHLAAFMGVPTIALYRTTNPTLWGIQGACIRTLICTTEDTALEQLDLAVEEFLG